MYFFSSRQWQGAVHPYPAVLSTTMVHYLHTRYASFAVLLPFTTNNDSVLSLTRSRFVALFPHITSYSCLWEWSIFQLALAIIYLRTLPSAG